MKLFLKWTGFVLFASLIGLVLAMAVVASARAQSPVAVTPRVVAQATPPAPYIGPWGYGYGPSGVYTPTGAVPYSYGPGMMGRGWSGSNYGSWGMGPGMMGPGMHGGMMSGYGGRYGIYSNASTLLTLDQAIEAARLYLSAYGNPDLALAEVIEFSNNFYGAVKEKSTGRHAFEVLIDRYTGAVYPEPGPNMMWNAQYGHMGGWWGQSGGAMTVTPEQARTNAQQWLEAYLPGTTTADEADAFYGYYTIEVLKDRQVYGMLSVNGYTSDIWYHTWHGDFVGLKEVEE